MQALTRSTTWYNSHDIHAAGQVGSAEKYIRDMPIEHQRDIPEARKQANRKALARFKNRPERVPWDWEKE